MYKKAVAWRSLLAGRRCTWQMCAQTRAEPMWVTWRTLDMRALLLDTSSTVALVIDAVRLG